MAVKKTTSTAISTTVNEDTLALLQEAYPVEQSAQRITLPRLGMVSKDKVEETGTGRDKKLTVVSPAGEFFTEEPSAEDAKEWEHTEIGTEVEGVILFQRKQLGFWDNDAQQFTSSPVYDTDSEVIPLWCNKSEVARGTAGDLKKLYEFADTDGKTKSKLKDNRVLYVKVGEKVYAMTLRGSSMFAFISYARKTLPNSVVTKFSSEEKENGTNKWNQMTFTPVRALSQAEAEDALHKANGIKEAISLEKAQYGAIDVEVIKARSDADEAFKKF